MSLFAYGTLMEPRVMTSVTGRQLIGTPSTLKHYRRLHFKNAPYPGLVPDETASVDGILYANLTAADWLRLDEFEGEMYFREEQTVTNTRGKSQSAWVYVVVERYRNLLSTQDWDFEYFCANEIDRYLKFI